MLTWRFVEKKITIYLSPNINYNTNCGYVVVYTLNLSYSNRISFIVYFPNLISVIGYKWEGKNALLVVKTANNEFGENPLLRAVLLVLDN